jgi:hypothetical protein
MLKALRMIDATLVALAGRILAAAYGRFGYAPVAAQFAIMIVFYLIGGIAGCYLVSRWSLPDALTGFLLIMGTSSTIWMTSSTWPYKRLWTRDMYEHSLRTAETKYRDRMTDRLVSLLAAVFCLSGMCFQITNGDATGAAVFTGLASLALSSVVNGYLRCARPPEPLAKTGGPNRGRT